MENFLRIPISMEQLIRVDSNELDKYQLYLEKDTNVIDENTVFYIDETISFNDDDDYTEIYPDLAVEKDLDQYFLGQIATDIIDNTRYQLKSPNINDFIKNFNYYADHDCFYDFKVNTK